MPVNPEAIAWYLKRSEDLLDDLRDRIQALRTRGGQIAGFSGAVLTLAGADATSILAALHGAARICAGSSLLIGAVLLILSFVTGLSGALLPKLVADISAEEVANYTSDRFIEEPTFGVCRYGPFEPYAPRSKRRPFSATKPRGRPEKPRIFFPLGCLRLGSLSVSSSWW